MSSMISHDPPPPPPSSPHKYPTSTPPVQLSAPTDRCWGHRGGWDGEGDLSRAPPRAPHNPNNPTTPLPLLPSSLRPRQNTVTPTAGGQGGGARERGLRRGVRVAGGVGGGMSGRGLGWGGANGGGGRGGVECGEIPPLPLPNPSLPCAGSRAGGGWGGSRDGGSGVGQARG